MVAPESHGTQAQSEEAAAVLALLLMPGTGPAAVHTALAVARYAAQPLPALVGRPVEGLRGQLPAEAAPVLPGLAACTPELLAEARRLCDAVKNAGGVAVLAGSPGYPEPLLSALGRQAPPVLFVRGAPRLLEKPGAAVVGAREVSEAGIEAAAACGSAFARAGHTVVSGGARGVDMHAHRAALAAGGRTVVVLPQGILTYRPPVWLRTALSAGRAAVVSQFPPHAPWETHAAITRNATISALARLVCVIEARRQGGSIRTARAGLDQGKRVLLMPAPGHEGLLTALRERGALPLLDDAGRVDAAGLAGHWAAAPAPDRQGDLFETPPRETPQEEI